MPPAPTQLSRQFAALLALLLALSLSGCRKGKADFFVLLPHAADLTIGSHVFWRGEKVGTVSAIEADQDKARIEARLEAAWRERLPADLRAAPIRNALSARQPALELYGGTTGKGLRIQPGQQLRGTGWPEAARWREWLSPGLLAFAAGATLLAIVFFIVRGIIRLLTLAALAALTALAYGILRSQWKELPLADWEARIATIAGETLQSPAAITAWRKLQTHFSEATMDNTATLPEQIAKAIETLEARGEKDAARELRTLAERASRQANRP